MIGSGFESSDQVFPANLAVPPQRAQDRAPYMGGITIPGQHVERPQPTILSLPGAWHGPLHFEALEPVIRELGMKPLVAMMSIDNPAHNYSDWADEAAEQAGDSERLWVLAHSRFGNVAPLVTRRIPVEGIIYLGAIIPGVETDKPAFRSIEENFPKHYEGYYSAIEEQGDLLHFNAQVGEELFWPELSSEDRQKFAAALRPMRRREEDVILESRPDVIEHAVIGQYDQVINPNWQTERAELLLGKNAVTLMHTGHSPFATHPHELGKVIFDIIEVSQKTAI